MLDLSDKLTLRARWIGEKLKWRRIKADAEKSLDELLGEEARLSDKGKRDNG